MKFLLLSVLTQLCCRGGALETELSVYSRLLTVNYLGCVELTSHLVPHMVTRGSGHVLVVSSVQGLLPIPQRAAYCSSKHALQAWADCLRAELVDTGLYVSVISPGYVQTDLSKHALTASGNLKYNGVIASHFWIHNYRRGLRRNGYQPDERLLCTICGTECDKVYPQWQQTSYLGPTLC